MKNLKAQEGGIGGGGPILGGEVLDTICERDATLSGYAPIPTGRSRTGLII